MNRIWEDYLLRMRNFVIIYENFNCSPLRYRRYRLFKSTVAQIVIDGSICGSTVVYKDRRYKFQNRRYKFIEKVTVPLKNIDCTADSNQRYR